MRVKYRDQSNDDLPLRVSHHWVRIHNLHKSRSVYDNWKWKRNEKKNEMNWNWNRNIIPMSRSNLGTPSSGKASSSNARSESEAYLGSCAKSSEMNWIELEERNEIEIEKNLNIDDTGRRSVLASFGIVIEYLRWCHPLWSRRHR